MKITKRQLRRIVKEEKARLVAERRTRAVIRSVLMEQPVPAPAPTPAPAPAPAPNVDKEAEFKKYADNVFKVVEDGYEKWEFPDENMKAMFADIISRLEIE